MVLVYAWAAFCLIVWATWRLFRFTLWLAARPVVWWWRWHHRDAKFGGAMAIGVILACSAAHAGLPPPVCNGGTPSDLQPLCRATQWMMTMSGQAAGDTLLNGGVFYCAFHMATDGRLSPNAALSVCREAVVEAAKP